MAGCRMENRQVEGRADDRRAGALALANGATVWPGNRRNKPGIKPVTLRTLQRNQWSILKT